MSEQTLRGALEALAQKLYVARYPRGSWADTTEPTKVRYRTEIRETLDAALIRTAKPTDDVVERVARDAAWLRDYAESVLDGSVMGVREAKRLREIADRLAALQGEMQPSEAWQPIETAPKDGTPIILSVRGHHPERPNANGHFVTVGRWQWSKDARLPHEDYPDDGGFLELKNRWGDGWGDGWGGNIGDRYWQPLPAPPAMRAAALRGDEPVAKEGKQR